MRFEALRNESGRALAGEPRMKLNPLPAIGRGCRTFFEWAHLAICALTTEDGRKGWAMLAALGCSFVMTLIAVAVLWIVRRNPNLAFTMGLAAMGTIIIV